jgi:hypothetical protein
LAWTALATSRVAKTPATWVQLLSFRHTLPNPTNAKCRNFRSLQTLLAWFTLRSRWRRYYVSSNYQWTFIGLQSVTFHTTVLFLIIAVITLLYLTACDTYWHFIWTT